MLYYFDIVSLYYFFSTRLLEWAFLLITKQLEPQHYLKVEAEALVLFGPIVGIGVAIVPPTRRVRLELA